MKKILISILIATLTVFFTQTTALAAGKVYEADGHGSSNEADDAGKEAAREEALGNALKIILDQYIDRVTKDQATLWVKNLVLAYPGYVVQKNFTGDEPVLSDISGQWECDVHVSLPRAALEAAWKEGMDFYKECFGRQSPTLSIFFQERVTEYNWDHIVINDYFIGRVALTGLPYRFDEYIKESWSAQQLAQLLNQTGFRVLINKQVEDLRKNQKKFAELAGQDLKVLTEISTKQGAHMFITGDSHILGPEPENRTTPGRVKWFWQGAAKCSMYWTDNAEVIATMDSRSETEHTSDFAGRIDAARAVGKVLAPKIVKDIFRQWSRFAFEGRTVTMTVLNCEFEQAMEIKKKLAAVLKIDEDDINSEPANDVATFEFKCKGKTVKITEKLLSQKFDTFKLKFMEARWNTIRLQVKN